MTARLPIQPRRRPAFTRSAFTLLEVLIAVGLLAVLSTLLIIGIKQLTTGGKRNQARVELQQAKSLFDAWQAVAHQPFPPTPLPAPNDVTAAGPDRFAPAVWFTRDVMALARSVPANAAAIGKLSGSGTMTFPTSQTMPFTPTEWTPTLAYEPFIVPGYGRVYLKDPTDPNIWVYYQAIQYVPASPPVIPPTNKAYWLPAYPVTTGGATAPPYADTTVPVPLDAWGNPMILVPGGQLQVAGATIRSPDGRPFFASAGPDGNFAAADDNLYSFEK